MENFITWVATISVITILYVALKRFFRGGAYTKSTLIDDKVVIITGANAGIGKATAVDLAKRGGKIYIACRDKTRGQAALEDIRKESGSEKVYFLQLDLASLESIREFSRQFHKLETRLDILINNAGILNFKKATTENGFEIHMGINHLGHFLLTNLLLDLLKNSAPSRIVVVSSVIYKISKIDKNDLMSINEKGSGFKIYGRSKLANILFTRELAKRLQGTGVTCNSCHPGGVNTNIAVNDSFLKTIGLVSNPFIKTPMEGAQTQIMLAVDPVLERVSGKYFTACQEENISPVALDDDLAKWLWDKSSELVSI